jgi:hypothetical protein
MGYPKTRGINKAFSIHMKKFVYETPETELILVRFEENILSGEPTTNPSSFRDDADVVDRSDEDWWN